MSCNSERQRLDEELDQECPSGPQAADGTMEGSKIIKKKTLDNLMASGCSASVTADFGTKEELTNVKLETNIDHACPPDYLTGDGTITDGVVVGTDYKERPSYEYGNHSATGTDLKLLSELGLGMSMTITTNTGNNKTDDNFLALPQQSMTGQAVAEEQEAATMIQPEDVYYFRFYSLLVGGGTLLLRAIFENALQKKGETLQQFLNSLKPTQQYRNLIEEQQNKLHPKNGCASIEDFDIVLLYQLIKHHLRSHVDANVLTYIKRIRELRNKHAHATETKMDTFTFNVEWSNLVITLQNGCTGIPDDVKKKIKDLIDKINLINNQTRIETILNKLLVKKEDFPESFQKKLHDIQTDHEQMLCKWQTELTRFSHDLKDLKEVTERIKKIQEQGGEAIKIAQTIHGHALITPDDEETNIVVQHILSDARENLNNATNPEGEIEKCLAALNGDVENEDVKVTNISCGSIVFEFQCCSLTSILDLIDYLCNSSFQVRLDEIAKALGKILGKTISITADGINIESIESLFKKFEKREYQTLMTFEMSCTGINGLSHAIEVFEEGKAEQSVNELAHALSKAVGKQVQLYTSIDMNQMKNAVQVIQDQLDTRRRMAVSNKAKVSNLIYLTEHGGTKLVRALFLKRMFDMKPNNENLETWTLDIFLKINRDKIELLKLNRKSLQVLFPAAGKQTDISFWDLSLLISILKTTCELSPDMKMTITALKKLRDKLAHLGDSSITDSKYKDHLDKIHLIFEIVLKELKDEELGNTLKEMFQKLDDGEIPDTEISSALEALHRSREDIKNSEEETRNTVKTEHNETRNAIEKGNTEVLDLLNKLADSIDEWDTGTTSIIPVKLKPLKGTTETGEHLTQVMLDLFKKEISEVSELYELLGYETTMRDAVHNFYTSFREKGYEIVKAEKGCILLHVRFAQIKSLFSFYLDYISGDLDIYLEELEKASKCYLSVEEFRLELILYEDDFCQVLSGIENAKQEHEEPQGIFAFGKGYSEGQDNDADKIKLYVQDGGPTPVLLTFKPLSQFDGNEFETVFESESMLLIQKFKLPHRASISKKKISEQEKVITGQEDLHSTRESPTMTSFVELQFTTTNTESCLRAEIDRLRRDLQTAEADFLKTANTGSSLKAEIDCLRKVHQKEIVEVQILGPSNDGIIVGAFSGAAGGAIEGAKMGADVGKTFDPSGQVIGGIV